MRAATSRQIDVGYIWPGGGGMREGMKQNGVEIGEPEVTADENSEQEQRSETTGGTSHV